MFIYTFLHVSVSPQKVKILRPPKMFQAQKEYRLVCLAEGSRPAPEITWSIGRQIIKSKVCVIQYLLAKDYQENKSTICTSILYHLSIVKRTSKG